MFNQLQKCNLELGFIGTSELKLTQFIKTKKEFTHVIFHHPDYINLELINPMKLKIHAQVYVILISESFQPTFSSLYQKFLFTGIITTNELNQLKPKFIIESILKFGYFPNNHINQNQWARFSKMPKPLPIPPITEKENTALHHLCHGFTLTDTADKMGVSVSRIRKLTSSLKSKCSCTDQKELVTISLTNNWVILDPNQYARKHRFLLAQEN